ncbi:MAG: RNA polymerase sigma factor [Deltaproteobacteria bacterium]|nr:RNA polymerase sigma factor [Deltaproteobacteria bacterium]
MDFSIESIYRQEFGRILAALIHLFGDFDIAEDAVQEAFTIAAERWPIDGVPREPRAWIIGTARHKAIDRIRRDSILSRKRDEFQRQVILEAMPENSEWDDGAIRDERLRLIFTCCHPALAAEAQIALSLRTLCGLTTEEIARAFFVSSVTMAQRLVRAKQKIRAARIPYEVPREALLSERLETVMAVIYLVFNEGYSASGGDLIVRADLCAEAIRLGRILHELLPEIAEVRGFLALMLLHDARRLARIAADGEMVLLEDQDRTLWNHEQIREGLALIESALRKGPIGPYSIQAAIAAVHARAARACDTDWCEIEALYAYLMRLQPMPIVELNHAVAVAMSAGPERGLQIIDSICARGELKDYHLLWAARADLLRRLGQRAEAAEAYHTALTLTSSEPERRFLQRRIREVELPGTA